MELISFLNKAFWEGSGYIILLAVSLILIFLDKKKNTRAKMMALYSVIVLFLVIYNPLIAPIGLKFFSEDRWAYLRIFYLLPLMTVLAYSAADFYADQVTPEDKAGKKVKFLAVICILIIMSGKLYSSDMYVKAENIYKIDSEALTISETILEDTGGAKTRALLPNEEAVIYGIRQYTGNIVVAGYSDDFTDEESLAALEEGVDFSYLVIRKNQTLTDLLRTREEYQYLVSTDRYFIYKKVGN